MKRRLISDVGSTDLNENDLELLRRSIRKMRGAELITTYRELSARYLRVIEKIAEHTEYIDEVGLSSRVVNALRHEGITFFAELLGMRMIDLLKIPNIGQGSLKEIQRLVESRGEHLRET